MTLWRELGGGRRGEKPAFLENGFQGGKRGARWPGLPGSRPRPRRRFLLFHVLPRPGFVCGAPGRRRLGSPRGPRGPRAAADLVCCRGRRRGSGRRGAGAVPRPAGGLGRCSGSRGRAPGGGTPSRRGLSASAPQPLHRGLREGRGSRAIGERPGRRAMCHGGDGGAGGRGEPVAWRRRGLGVEGRDGCGCTVRGARTAVCGLLLGGGDDRLGPVLGGFPLKEVVGHLKAQSTCF